MIENIQNTILWNIYLNTVKPTKTELTRGLRKFLSFILIVSYLFCWDHENFLFREGQNFVIKSFHFDWFYCNNLWLKYSVQFSLLCLFLSLLFIFIFYNLGIQHLSLWVIHFVISLEWHLLLWAYWDILAKPCCYFFYPKL